MALVRASIPGLLKPGANKIFGMYEKGDTEWKEIYKESTSKMADEWDYEMRYFGYGQLKTEAGPIARDTMAGQRYTTNYHHETFGLGFDISEEAIDDDLYDQQFPKAAENLKESLSGYKNMLAALYILQGFAVNKTADNQFVFSSLHPYDGGTYSNLINMDLNETSLEQAMILAASYVTLAGVKTPSKLEKLIVGPELSFNASRLTKSEYRTNTPNNDKNPIVTTGLLPKGYVVNNYFNVVPNRKPWLVLTNINESGTGFRLMQRKKLDYTMRMDEDNRILICNAVERYSLGMSNPRAGIACQG
jgi:hypothetical protein